MTRFLVATVLLLACAAPVGAQTLWNDGYYYYSSAANAQPYTRVSTYHAGYRSGGCYYPSYYTYDYVPYYAPATYTAPAKDAFEASLGKAIELKVAYDGKANLIEKAALATGVKFSSKEELFRFIQQAQGGNGYGAYGNYHVYQQLTPVAAVTQTYNSQAAVYGDAFNLREMGLMLNQDVKRADEIAVQRSGLFAAHVTLVTTGATKVAEINARRDAHIANTREFARALEGTPMVETRGIKFTITPGQYPQRDSSAATPQTKQGVLRAWITSAQSCMPCHLNPNTTGYKDKFFKGVPVEELAKYPKGGFDLDLYPAMSQADREKIVYPRIDPSAALNKRMPRKADGSAGVPLTAQELQLFQMVEDVPLDAQASPQPEQLQRPQVDPKFAP